VAKTAVSNEQMTKLVAELKEDFEYVLIDCPAGIEHGFKNSIIAADKAIVVTVPEVSAVRDADRIIGLLLANEVSYVKLIINRLRKDMIDAGNMLNIDDTLEILSVDLLGIVPEDTEIIRSSNIGEPVVIKGDTPSGIAYRNIVARILGEDVPLMELKKEPKGFFASIKKLFSRK